MLHVDAPFKETLAMLGMYMVEYGWLDGCLGEDSEEEDEDYVEEEANEETSDESSSSEEEDTDKKSDEELQEDEGVVARGDWDKTKHGVLKNAQNTQKKQLKNDIPI